METTSTVERTNNHDLYSGATIKEGQIGIEAQLELQLPIAFPMTVKFEEANEACGASLYIDVEGRAEIQTLISSLKNAVQDLEKLLQKE